MKEFGQIVYTKIHKEAEGKEQATMKKCDNIKLRHLLMELNKLNIAISYKIMHQLIYNSRSNLQIILWPRIVDEKLCYQIPTIFENQKSDYQTIEPKSFKNKECKIFLQDRVKTEDAYEYHCQQQKIQQHRYLNKIHHIQSLKTPRIYVKRRTLNEQFFSNNKRLAEPYQDSNLEQIGQSKSLKNKDNSLLFHHFRNLCGKPKEDFIFNLKLYKEQLKLFYSQKYDPKIIDKVRFIFINNHKFLIFIEFPPIINYSNYILIINKLHSFNEIDLKFLGFILIDYNNDGLLCPEDIFKLLKDYDSSNDFSQIAKWVSQKQESPKDKVILQEIFLLKEITRTEFNQIINSQDEVKHLSDAKKITIYHLSFYSLDHHQVKRKINEEKQDAFEIIRRHDQMKDETKQLIQSLYKETSQFKINFGTFLTIFDKEPPIIVFDFLLRMSLQPFKSQTLNHIDEVYQAGVNFAIMQLKKSKDFS